MTEPPNQPERPRAEPEILPPDHSGRPDWQREPGRDPWRGDAWQGDAWQADARRRNTWRPGYGRTGYVYSTRIGPFGFFVLMLGLAAIVAAILIVFIGAFLIWIPVAALIVLVAVIARIFRRL